MCSEQEAILQALALVLNSPFLPHNHSSRRFHHFYALLCWSRIVCHLDLMCSHFQGFLPHAQFFMRSFHLGWQEYKLDPAGCEIENLLRTYCFAVALSQPLASSTHVLTSSQAITRGNPSASRRSSLRRVFNRCFQRYHKKAPWSCLI